VHHQTVQRRVERALAYGALAALDDRPRPQPTITPEAKAWLVSLACDKAKEHGYAARIVTTRLFARHAREHGPAPGTNASPAWCNRGDETSLPCRQPSRAVIAPAPHPRW
jgi:hypothetical protein